MEDWQVFVVRLVAPSERDTRPRPRYQNADALFEEGHDQRSEAKRDKHARTICETFSIIDRPARELFVRDLR